MNLVILSDNYPSDRMPNKGVFVYNLVQQLSHYHQITVIAPFRIRHLFKTKHKSGYGKESCVVYRPLYFSFSSKKILGFDTGIWSRNLMAKAVYRCLSRLQNKPDIIYAHFLANALSGLSYVQKHPVPFVIASGESGYTTVSDKRKKELQRLKEKTSHIICVSETNKKGLVELGFSENIMTVIPNAVDYDLFKPLDRETCKKKLGISRDKFVVGFVGNFIHRKGPNRIIEAIKQLQDKNIQLVCVGGKEGLTANEFTKTIPPLPNYQLPEIYNAFDIFVLPTLSEGHCNAIEEAKACCIPIVSSLGTSVETQIDNTTGILINPLNIHEIAEAIQKLKSQPAIRMSMAEALKLKGGEQSLKSRAQKISSLLTKTVNKNK